MSQSKKLMGVQQILIKTSAENDAILRYLCEQSGKLYNSGVYFARQTYFKTGKVLAGKFDLIYEKSVSGTTLNGSLPSVPAQQTLMSVIEAFKSFKELKKKKTLHFKPKTPGYLTGSKLYKIAYPNSGAGKPSLLKSGLIRFPLGLAVKRWFGISEFFLPMPSNLDFSKIKEFTILPKNGSFYLECSYLKETVIHNLDGSKVLGIDLGTSANLAACIDTVGQSFLLDARQMKSMNQWWNKQVANYKEGKEADFWDANLDRWTRKRNHQMRDGINKAARLIVDHCVQNRIGNIVCGWNEGFKSNANLGRLNNQKFVQMPLAKLRDRIDQLCAENGIRFEVTEEAYTSKGSFLDGDSLPQFGAKPDGWKASGKRVLRGLYCTSNGWKINADLNGAANIIRKVAGILGLDLSGLSRAQLTAPRRIRLWQLKPIQSN